MMMAVSTATSVTSIVNGDEGKDRKGGSEEAWGDYNGGGGESGAKKDSKRPKDGKERIENFRSPLPTGKLDIMNQRYRKKV
jgi:hypothetical protein